MVSCTTGLENNSPINADHALLLWVLDVRVGVCQNISKMSTALDIHGPQPGKSSNSQGFEWKRTHPVSINIDIW